jgi:hypothetical protein
MLLSIHMWFLLKGTHIIPANSSRMLHVCTGWRPSQFTVVLSSESQVIQSRQGRLERPVLWFVNICLGLKLLWRPTKNIWACSVYISRIMRKPTGDLLVAPGFKLSLKIYPCPTWPDFHRKVSQPSSNDHYHPTTHEAGNTYVLTDEVGYISLLDRRGLETITIPLPMRPEISSLDQRG